MKQSSISASQPTLTLEQFLKLPDTKPASEFRDGVVIQKPMPRGKHSLLQKKWTEELDRRSVPLQAGMAFPELRCVFAGRAIVPDVAYLTWGRIPRDAAGEIADENPGAPDLVIEILSPEQTLHVLTDKITFCVENGCSLGLLMDPVTKRALLARRGHALVTLTRGLLDLTSVLPGAIFTVEEVFGWLAVPR